MSCSFCRWVTEDSWHHPTFMDLDVNVIDDIIDKVESDIMPMVQDTAQKAQRYIPGR